MKVYSLKRTQFLPITISVAWDFFSSPENLMMITPDDVKIKILHVSGGKRMYAGQIMRYIITPLHGISVNWMTEITHVQEPDYFIDEQRFGPFALWNHQHAFREVPGGVEMTDEVNYAIPFGVLGRLANRLFVERQVMAIFEFRRRVLETYFIKNDDKKKD